jgi:hypothetical protein
MIRIRRMDLPGEIIVRKAEGVYTDLQQAPHSRTSSLVHRQLLVTTNPRLSNDNHRTYDFIIHHRDVCNIVLLDV